MIRKYALRKFGNGQRKGESLIFILMGFWITIYFNVMTFWWTVWSGIWYFIHMVIHVHIVGYIFPLFLSSGRISPSPNIQNTWIRSSNVKPLVGPPVPGRQKALLSIKRQAQLFISVTSSLFLPSFFFSFVVQRSMET